MSIQPDKTKLESEYKHDRPLTSCVWDWQSRFVFFGAEDNAVHRLELGSNTVTHFSGHESWVRAMAVSAEGQQLYTGGYDGRVAKWPADATEPKPQAMIEGHQGWIRALALSKNGRWLATCGNDRLIKLWNTSDLSLLRTLSGHESHVYNVGFSKDDSQLVSCDLRGIVKAWDMNLDSPPVDQAIASSDIVKAESLAKYDTTFRADIGGARGLTFSQDGKVLALAGITNVTNAFAGIGEVAVVLVDWEQHKIQLQLECKDKQRGTVWGVAHHSAGYWVGASGGSGGFLIFWKGDVPHEAYKMKLKTDARGLSLSPDGTKLAVAHSDSHLRLYALNG